VGVREIARVLSEISSVILVYRDYIVATVTCLGKRPHPQPFSRLREKQLYLTSSDF
jgi:hypothetical protein